MHRKQMLANAELKQKTKLFYVTDFEVYSDTRIASVKCSCVDNGVQFL